MPAKVKSRAKYRTKSEKVSWPIWIASAEVQGYVYQTWHELGNLAKQMGDQARGDELLAKAAALKERFNNDFWMPASKYAAAGIDGHGQQLQVIKSNAGQLVGTGIL